MNERASIIGLPLISKLSDHSEPEAGSDDGGIGVDDEEDLGALAF